MAFQDAPSDPMRLRVSGAVEMELPLRLFALLAQQGVAIDRAVVARDAGGYAIEIEAAPVGEARAAVIVEKVRAIILVTAADAVQAAASPCRLISESIRPSSALEQTPSTSASSCPSATT